MKPGPPNGGLFCARPLTRRALRGAVIESASGFDRAFPWLLSLNYHNTLGFVRAPLKATAFCGSLDWSHELIRAPGDQPSTE